MRAVVYDAFGAPPSVRNVADPTPAEHGAIIAVEATGLCRSDWHGWVGHDPGIAVPHVPGHELAGALVAVGAGVTGWRPGSRVTVPFVCACGTCAPCLAGEQQVCSRQTQPGFTGWGSFADLVAIEHADVNLVALPDEVSARTAAALGCRFATAFRAVVQQGRVAPGEWVAVHGCGGVGLSAVMVAVAAGASVIAVDISPAALSLARRMGATEVVDASATEHVSAAVRDLTGGGAHLSLDCLGSEATCAASVRSVRWRGRHVQVGLLPAALGHPRVPMDLVIGKEISLLGCHGMAAHAYPPMLAMVVQGRLCPDALVTRLLDLDAAGAALVAMGTPGATPAGVTVIEPGAGV